MIKVLLLVYKSVTGVGVWFKQCIEENQAIQKSVKVHEKISNISVLQPDIYFLHRHQTYEILTY